MICRSLNLTTDSASILVPMASELDQAYRLVSANIDNNPYVRFETIKGNEELILTQLDKLDEPPSLTVFVNKDVASTLKKSTSIPHPY